MKNIVRASCIFLLLISVFSSCSVEKRHYRHGYNIEWPISKSAALKNEKANKEKASANDGLISSRELDVKRDVSLDVPMASADNKTAVEHRAAKKFKNRLLALAEDCDLILLKNGEEIKAKVIEVTQDLIKYRKCGDVKGETLTLKKSDVFMLKYPNGTKEVMNREESADVKRSAEKEDKGAFGILSFVCIALFILLGSIGGGAEVLLLLLLAIIFGAIGMGRKRKLRGLAIAGFTLSMLFVLLVLLAAIAFSGGLL